MVLKTFLLEIPKNFHKFSLVFLIHWKTRNSLELVTRNSFDRVTRISLEWVTRNYSDLVPRNGLPEFPRKSCRHFHRKDSWEFPRIFRKIVTWDICVESYLWYNVSEIGVNKATTELPANTCSHWLCINWATTTKLHL